METYKYNIGNYEYEVNYFIDSEDWVNVKLPNGEIKKASLGLGNKLPVEFLIQDIYGDYLNQLYYFYDESRFFAKKIIERLGKSDLNDLERLSNPIYLLLSCAFDEDYFKIMQLNNPRLVMENFYQLQSGIDINGKELTLNQNSRKKLIDWSDPYKRVEMMRLNGLD